MNPKSEAVVETGYAKINLALHIRSRRADGYHDLETVFAFADAGDELRALPSDRLTLHLCGPFAAELTADPNNLVLKAARALQDHYGVAKGAAITLDKRLPIASGIGGGSADAAAALRLLVRLWHLPDERETLLEIGSQLGADVPACIASKTCIGLGTGTTLCPVDITGLAGTPLLLVNPLLPCPTGPVFNAWDGLDRGPLYAHLWASGRNDLQAPAIGLVPIIGDVLTALEALDGTTFVRMSGSGATCFALFSAAEKRDEAAKRLHAEKPEWWTLATVLRG
jgi:4-diphosphocytidyl-2-C-methyl-D-erythritol kinase